MPKRKAQSQKKSAPRKKVKSASTIHTEATQQRTAQGSAIALPVPIGTPSTIPQEGEGAPDTQQQTTQGSAIAAPVATAAPSTVQQEGEDAPVPIPVSEQAVQDSSIALPLLAEATPTVHQEEEESVEESTSDLVAPATAENVEKKTILDPDTLMRIFYEVILRTPTKVFPGNFGTPWHFAGYKQSVIDCSARATLRSVCKHWADLIADEINLWRDIHIDGKRIPSPLKSYGELPEGEESVLPVVIVGEMPRAALSVERSQESPINLVLVDPTYDPEPHLFELGRAYLPRPGVLEFLHAVMDKPMVSSLSISTDDIHFVKDFFNAGEYLYERNMPRDVEGEMGELTDAKKISLACDGEETDHFDLSTLPPSTTDTFNGVRTRAQRRIEFERVARLRKKFKVWPELHTLRICTRDDDLGGRCALPAERAPALRHLELDLPNELPLWLWTFPYPQLTHLTLATGAPSVILLGILARCISLESLTITLRYHHHPEVDTLTVERIVLSLLNKLSVQIDVCGSGDPKVGRPFLDHISTPCLQSLEVITRNVDRACPITHLLRRSQCQLRELRLDFSASVLDPCTGLRTYISPADRFNLPELLHFVSPTLEKLAIQSGQMDGSWLEQFSAPHLQKITILCFGIEQEIYKRKEIDDIHGAAHDLALYVLRWAEKRMKGATEEEKSKLRIEYLAGRASSGVRDSDGADVFYGKSIYGRCEKAPGPDTVGLMLSRIRALGGNIDVWWTTIKR
ncbi:hypothetical protein DFP72DRAFT_1176397 [Ephemerocybe angulata]|uniref:F-box domain-containing protein n=1 Tax=Ephemerocybe angulata TaxID=980116 RepID=A0A8H6HFK0_9AGAR|nr:hypothetical protein DFP72DRAFT_1176397 [Tulosesus angulatus]